MSRIVEVPVTQQEVMTRGQAVTPDFRIYTAGIESLPGTSNIVRMIGSSTEQDMQGDYMSISALNSMTKAAPNLTIWLNHDYSLPDSIFGSVVDTPSIIHSKGVADLELRVEVETENPAAARVKRYIDNGRRLGCSIGCMVTKYEVPDEEDEGDFWYHQPIIIHEVYVLEYSVVGIPANQRSWVENAIRGVFTRSADPALAPAMKSLWPRAYKEVLSALPVEQGKLIDALPARPKAAGRLEWLPDTKMFLLTQGNKQKSLSREEVPAMLQKNIEEQIRKAGAGVKVEGDGDNDADDGNNTREHTASANDGDDNLPQPRAGEQGVTHPMHAAYVQAMHYHLHSATNGVCCKGQEQPNGPAKDPEDSSKDMQPEKLAAKPVADFDEDHMPHLNSVMYHVKQLCMSNGINAMGGDLPGVDTRRGIEEIEVLRKAAPKASDLDTLHLKAMHMHIHALTKCACCNGLSGAKAQEDITIKRLPTLNQHQTMHLSAMHYHGHQMCKEACCPIGGEGQAQNMNDARQDAAMAEGKDMSGETAPKAIEEQTIETKAVDIETAKAPETTETAPEQQEPPQAEATAEEHSEELPAEEVVIDHKVLSTTEPKKIAEMTLQLEGLPALIKNLQDASVLLKDFEERQKSIESMLTSTQKEAQKAVETVAAIKNMPLGSPIRQKREIDPQREVTHEQMLNLSASDGTLVSALTLTSEQVVPLANGASVTYRVWPDGIGGTVQNGVRPELTGNQIAMMSFEDVAAYRKGMAARVPKIDDPGDKIHARNSLF